ncbi:MAG: adenosine deaminase, partial [Bacteroidia bacterium]|nr:adenosine deaminase [Bacteroidia bacterium]
RMTNDELVGALLKQDLDLIRAVPKVDLHNHFLLGMRLKRLSGISGLDIKPFRYHSNGIQDINNWIREHYFPVLKISGIFPKLIKASFQQAVEDGVTILEASIDAGFGHLYGISPEEVVETLRLAHHEVAPHIDFRPCLGFSRVMPVRHLLRFFEPYLDLNYFTSIDLYDDEKSQPVQNFREIFRFAHRLGLRCTAHAGEFGTAEQVREAVEVLDLDAVQHGIAAASSPEVMKWLAERAVPLNICPTSNLVLQRVSSYATHPIRILYDHGVIVTINTDDVTLFDQGVSEELLLLYNEKVFSSEELDQIRREGFDSA